MKIGIYDLYLDTLGGGEKYALTIGSLLSEKGEVDVFWKATIKKKAELITGLDLSKVNFVGDIPKSRSSDKLSSLRFTNGYDLFFYVTDGSLFFSRAKKSYLIIQAPQKDMYRSSFLNQLKLQTWTAQLCYSNYVKNYITQWWKKQTFVLPPAIQTESFKEGKKEQIILSVGRFFPLPHSKKQEVMVETFKKMTQQGLKNWRLILIGGADPEARDYLEKVKVAAKGYPIEIYTNINFTDLKKWYAKAAIYWHATGFGENLEFYPERAEHFGMTTLEAMSAGGVPIVFPAGGQKEIVDDKQNGIFWTTPGNLAENTLFLINNKNLWKKYSQAAREKSLQYTVEQFRQNLFNIINK